MILIKQMKTTSKKLVHDDSPTFQYFTGGSTEIAVKIKNGGRMIVKLSDRELDEAISLREEVLKSPLATTGTRCLGGE